MGYDRVYDEGLTFRDTDAAFVVVGYLAVLGDGGCLANGQKTTLSIPANWIIHLRQVV
jgi:hypothetical protein